MTNKYIDMKTVRKCVVSVLLLFIIVGIYAMIFVFSGQEGKTSGSISYEVSKQCVEILDKLSWQDWSAQLKEEMAQNMEHPIRKLAHFGEYALLALAIFSLWNQWRAWSNRAFWGITGWIALSAIADEIHQYFVPGRYCSIWDVCIDTCGGIFGLCVGYCLLRLFERRRRHGIKL